MSDPISFPVPAPVEGDSDPLGGLIPEVTLASIPLSDGYEPLLRHLSNLREELAPGLGSLKQLTAGVLADHEAGLTRDVARDYLQAIEQLHALTTLLRSETTLLAAISRSAGVSIPKAAAAAGMSPNTFRRTLTTTRESLLGQGGVPDDSPF